MHTKQLILYTIATGAGITAAQDAPDPTAAPGPGHMPPLPPFMKSVDPASMADFHSNIHSMGSSVINDPMFQSIKDVFATAIPKSYIDEIRANPKAAHDKYKTTVPEWIQAIPTDVKDFIKANADQAKSIFEKDFGPLPTGFHDFPGMKASGGSSPEGEVSDAAQQKESESDEKKAEESNTNEAAGLRVMGAAVSALVGVVGVAALLL